MAAVDGASADSAWVKHYNFVDFSRFGSAWSPTYFNIVRDPIERVCDFTTDILNFKMLSVNFRLFRGFITGAPPGTWSNGSWRFPSSPCRIQRCSGWTSILVSEQVICKLAYNCHNIWMGIVRSNVQGSAKSRASGCVIDAGIARQKW